MSAFGPDGSKQIDFGGSHTITVPPRQRLLLRFSFSARWENAIIVYSKQTLEQLAERGNYNRSLEDFITDNSGSEEPLEILITAWHKTSTPDAKVPWIQSKEFKVSNKGNATTIGFNDGGQDFSFENAMVTVVALT
jgi:hypothetical protein